MNSSKRKLSLSGWLKENDNVSYNTSLKLQKFLFFYEVLTKIAGEQAEFTYLTEYNKHGNIEQIPNNDEDLKNILIKSFKKNLHHLKIISKKLTNKLNNEIPIIIEELNDPNDSENIVAIGITYNKELYLTTPTYLDRFSYYSFYHCNDYDLHNINDKELTKKIKESLTEFSLIINKLLND